MLKRLKETTIALFMGRGGISPKVHKFLQDHGDESITEIIVSVA